MELEKARKVIQRLADVIYTADREGVIRRGEPDVHDLETALVYALKLGVVFEDDVEAIKEFALSILVGIGEQQHQVVSEDKAVEMYLDAIEQMLVTGHVFMKHKDHPENADRIMPKARTSQPEMIGWYDWQFWYLLPRVAYRLVWEFYRSSGVMFPESERGVRVKLLEDGVLLPQGGRFTYRLWLNSQEAPRVLRISRPTALDMVPGDISEAA